jgi:cyanate lyase
VSKHFSPILGELATGLFTDRLKQLEKIVPKTIHSERHVNFRARLVRERKSKGLTQTQVAASLGKPPSYVAKFEIGERRLDVLEFLDVAAVIGFDPAEFIRLLSADRVS